MTFLDKQKLFNVQNLFRHVVIFGVSQSIQKRSIEIACCKGYLVLKMHQMQKSRIFAAGGFKRVGAGDGDGVWGWVWGWGLFGVEGRIAGWLAGRLLLFLLFS